MPLQREFSHLSTSEPSTNPWQPALDSKAPPTRPPIPSLPQEDSGKNAWAAPLPTRTAPPIPPLDTTQHVLVDVDEPESPAWDEDEASPVVHELPADNTFAIAQMNEDRHAWDDQAHPPKQNLPAPISAQPFGELTQQGEAWKSVDYESQPIGPQESGIAERDDSVVDRNLEEPAPALPPRTPEHQVSFQPSQPVTHTDTGDTGESLSSPNTLKQKAETYEIKKIKWHDAYAAHNPRMSPILVQNTNGPCPLLALVNALTLSTPADANTALVETLGSREQVSLGLLLDAVFDELMSGRRGDGTEDLPDVNDLYRFLLALHTGMNVNPRFFPAPPAKGSIDPRNSMSHVHPNERESSLPGTFEETREMKLYSTFSIPLIHGWLPEADSPAYAALKRTAQSYEESQNMMFQEEVLEEKLRNEGLSFEEQATLEDINTIKAFFASNATQLTPYGLKAITASIAPGSVAILFRNDHFSTLYRHPDTLQLLQLVTDMGYAGHEEVVWESLTDINGENAEFLSGHFRHVGGAPSTPHVSDASAADGRTPAATAQGHRVAPHSESHQSAPPKSSTTEQEDHDLALAMQLQEEEEERLRVETARRRRETELSQQYIEHQGQVHNSNSNIPISQRGGGNAPRGRGRGTLPRASNNIPEVRPTIPPRRNHAGGQPIDPEAGVDAPPPSYEQAAGQDAYVPPANHPVHPSLSPIVGVDGRRMSAFSANSTMQSPSRIGAEDEIAGGGRGGPNGRGGRRPTLVDQIPGRLGAQGGGYPGKAQQGGKEKDCVVM